MTPGVRADGSRIQAACSIFCILLAVLRVRARMHSKHSSMNTGLGRDAITEREIDLTLYKVEGKLNTTIWVSRASGGLGVGSSLPSG